MFNDWNEGLVKWDVLKETEAPRYLHPPLQYGHDHRLISDFVQTEIIQRPPVLFRSGMSEFVYFKPSDKAEASHVLEQI